MLPADPLRFHPDGAKQTTNPKSSPSANVAPYLRLSTSTVQGNDEQIPSKSQALFIAILNPAPPPCHSERSALIPCHSERSAAQRSEESPRKICPRGAFVVQAAISEFKFPAALAMTGNKWEMSTQPNLLKMPLDNFTQTSVLMIKIGNDPQPCREQLFAPSPSNHITENCELKTRCTDSEFKCASQQSSNKTSS